MIYAGDLGDAWQPTKEDRKLSIDVTGQPAKDICDAIYPDIKAECTAEKGERQRREGHVWCAYRPSNGYTCYFGFDLRTGRRIAGRSHENVFSHAAAGVRRYKGAASRIPLHIAWC